MPELKPKESWSSSAAFLLAAIGAAVGLGNLWRFPFMAGQNGGGAFVLVYLGWVIVLGVPLMAAELALGRRGRQSPVETMRVLRKAEGAGRGWMAIGWISILMPLAALSYYSIVAGWSLEYIVQAARGTFSGFTAEASQANFGALVGSPERLIFWHTVYVGATVFFVARGVRRGLEAAIKAMLPALFVILVVLVGYAAVKGDFARGLSFLFQPDFSKLTFPMVLMALGQAFFSLAVGVGAMITYGAYLPRDASLPQASVVICGADTTAALLAGLAIFPIVFAAGLAPGDGPGLIFQTLPVAFGDMPAGALVGTLFFILLAFAAFSSSLGMLEPVVSWLEEHRGFSRPWMAVGAGALAWAGGIAFALSFNVWSDVRPLAMVEFLADKGLFELMDFFVANVLIPVNALLLALFAGWVFSPQAAAEELGLGPRAYAYWRGVIRYVAPVTVGMVLISSVKDGLGL